MKITYNRVNNITKTQVICDTNVWYGFNQGKFSEVKKDYTLIPTLLTLGELATSEVMVHDIVLFQNTIKAIYNNGGPILPLDPIDYVLAQQDPKYPVKEEAVELILDSFSHVLSLKIEQGFKIGENLKTETLEKCKKCRSTTFEFAEYSNSMIDEIRSRINKGIGKKEHLKIDATSINQEMIRSIFNEHVRDRNYSIIWNKFDWEKIDLFMKVTQNFFRKVETTKGMKIKANDAIDWFNILYVSPQDKYLTLDGPWKLYIENDDRIKHYLYK